MHKESPQIGHNAFIDICDLCIHYPKSEFSVEDFCIAVKKGEFIVLLGESGSGKTTILNAVAGFVRPSYGDIRIGGISVLDKSPRDRNFAMVFQGNGLFPHMTVYENLEFGLKSRGVAKHERRARVEEAATKVRLSNKLSRYPEELSSGQRQRVELARLYLRQAPIWLLDEPLSNLDPLLKYELREEIRALHEEQGATTLYVTHSQSEALALATRIALIRSGRLIQYDQPDRIYDRPTSSYAAEFFGEPGMNLVDGILTVSASQATVRVELLQYEGSFSCIDACISTPCWVGFRPEDCIFANAPYQAKKIVAKIVSRELRGLRVLARVTVNGANMVVEGPREIFHSAQWVEFTLNPSRLHFFSSKDGIRLDIGTSLGEELGKET